MSEAYTNATQRIGPEREPEPDVNDCALVQDLLPLYLDHEVSPESHGRIANHIAQCERCANYLAGARSMRVQLMRDQQAVRATTGASAVPAVAHAQLTPNRTPGTFVPKLGRLLLAAAAVIGALILSPVLIPAAVVVAVPVGLFMLVREAWRRWGGQPTGAPSVSTGAAKAMLTALVSVLGALLCVGLIFGGLATFTENLYSTTDQLAGVFMGIIGLSGLVAINQRRGWLPQYAAPPVVQQAFRLILLGGGVLVGFLIVQQAFFGTPLLMILLLIVAGVVWSQQRRGTP